MAARQRTSGEQDATAEGTSQGHDGTRDADAANTTAGAAAEATSSAAAAGSASASGPGPSAGSDAEVSEALALDPDPDVLERVPTTTAPAPSETDDAPNCPICTEDFEMGEDIRVLPCDHSFHPPCIDPWLLNVSGTCPLCRTELRGPSIDADATNNDSLDPHDPVTNPSVSSHLAIPASNRSSHRISAAVADLLRLRTARDAPAEERIAALRWFRSRRPGAPRSMANSPVPGDGSEEPGEADGLEGARAAVRRGSSRGGNRSREASRNRNAWRGFRRPRLRRGLSSSGDGDAAAANAASGDAAQGPTATAPTATTANTTTTTAAAESASDA